MTKCLHLLIVLALWGIGSVTQTATALEVAADGKTAAESLDGHNVTSPILIAAPQNLNPGLHEPPPVLPIIPGSGAIPVDGLESPSDSAEPLPESLANPSAAPSEPPSLEASSPQTHVPFIEWKSLEIDFSNSLSNFDQGNHVLAPIFRGQLVNGDPISFSPGFNQFEMPAIESVTHIPLTVAWEGDINNVGPSHWRRARYLQSATARYSF